MDDFRLETRGLLRACDARSAEFVPDFERLCYGQFGTDEHQLEVLRDRSKDKCILWGRRRGKSFVAAMLLLRACYRYPHPDVWNPYVALTRVNAKRYFWPILKIVIARLGIPARVSEGDLTVKIPGCSSILLGGCEDRAAIERWRGGKYGALVRDELGAWGPYIDEFDDAIDPSLADLDGESVYTGTPGPVCDGYWHELSRTGKEGIPVFHTTMFTSPHIADPKAYANRVMSKRGWDETSVTYRREYGAEWIQDLEVLVYPLEPSRNSVSELPEPLSDHGWRFVISIDPGYTEACGMVVLAVHDAHKPTFIIDAWKRSQQIPQQVSDQVNIFRRRYPNAAVVFDAGGLGKPYAEETRRRLQIPVIAAEKTERKAAVRWTHDMVRSGQIQVLDCDETQPIRDEAAVLQWDETKQDHNKSQRDNKWGQKADHCWDATIYGNKQIRHYSHTPHVIRPKPGTQAYFREQEAEIVRSMEDRYQQREEGNEWDR